MHEQVQKALQVLIGKPLWSSGRAADLEWFQFGQRKTVKGARGGTKEVGEYALHGGRQADEAENAQRSRCMVRTKK